MMIGTCILGLMFFLIGSSGESLAPDYNRPISELRDHYFSLSQDYLDECIEQEQILGDPDSNPNFLGVSIGHYSIYTNSPLYKDYFLLNLMRGEAVDRFFSAYQSLLDEVEEDRAEYWRSAIWQDGSMEFLSIVLSDPSLLTRFDGYKRARMAVIMGDYCAFWKDRTESVVYDQPSIYARIVFVLTGCYVATGDIELLDDIAYWVDRIEGDIRTNGALEYMSDQAYGPVYWYFEDAAVHLAQAKYFLKNFGDPAEVSDAVAGLEDLGDRLKDFYKKFLTGPGHNEYYSCVWWKNLTRHTSYVFGPGSIGYLTDDPVNIWRAFQIAQRKNMYLKDGAIYFDFFSGILLDELKDKATEPPQDQFLFFDETREAYRSRYGKFSYVLQGGELFGSSAGVTYMDEYDDIAAMVSRVTPIVFRGQDPAYLRYDATHMYISSWEGHDHHITRNITHDKYCMVLNRYNPHYKQWYNEPEKTQRLESSMDWMVEQLWFGSPESIVGLCVTTAQEDTFGTGLGVWITCAKQNDDDIIEQINPNWFRINGLDMKIWPYSTYEYNTLGLSVVNTLSMGIKTHPGLYITDEGGRDMTTGTNIVSIVQYPAGFSRNAMIEIFPSSSTPLNTSPYRLNSIWVAIEFLPADDHIWIVYNRTDTPQTMDTLTYLKDIDVVSNWICVTSEGNEYDLGASLVVPAYDCVMIVEK